MLISALKRVWRIAHDAVTQWFADSAPHLGASIAFYSIFALAPLLVIAIAIASAIFGEEAARGQIVGQIAGLIGREAAKGVEDMIRSASKQDASLIGSLIGFATLLLGASGVFVEMKYAFDRIWKAQPRKSGGLTLLLRARLTAIALVLAVGFLAIVSLVVSAAINALGGYIFGMDSEASVIMLGLDFLMSLGLLTLAFAGLLYALPSAKVGRYSVLIGGFTSALLFTVGKQLIGLYLGRASTTSAFGAAGSFVAVIMWVYYSAQILLLGAEVAAVLDGKTGSNADGAPPARSGPARGRQRSSTA